VPAEVVSVPGSCSWSVSVNDAQLKSLAAAAAAAVAAAGV